MDQGAAHAKSWHSATLAPVVLRGAAFRAQFLRLDIPDRMLVGRGQGGKDREPAVTGLTPLARPRASILSRLGLANERHDAERTVARHPQNRGSL